MQNNNLRSRILNLSNWQVLGILVGVGVAASTASGIINAVYGVESGPDWWVGWLQNFGTEIFGAFLTFVLLEFLVRNRQEKERLIRQMRSKDNGLALQAVAELGAHGWLGDGSLEEANLINANLRGVTIWDLDLRSANLHGANLAGAKLERAILTHTNLWNVDLRDAQLLAVNLEGADLMHARLAGAVLSSVEMDSRTRLPDGDYWTPDTDMQCYTDPAHPEYFEPVEQPRHELAS
jgi:hypothetical protein